MRVLLSSTPEQSHLAPQVPLARELQRRGHEVLVACGATLGRFARRAGLEAVPAGLDLDPDTLGTVPQLDVVMPPGITPETMSAWAIKAVALEKFAASLAGDLRRIAEEWRPDVMVRDRGEFAAWAVGEAVGVAVVTITFGRLPDPVSDAAAGGDAFQELRRSQGLPADPELSTLYAGPVLVPAPATYMEPGIPVLPTVSFVRPTPYDTSSDELPAWVDDLGARPVICVTLGNILNRKESFEPFLEGLANEAIDVIVTVGRAVDPAGFGPLPANIRVERYVPLSLLLSKLDAIVCHGGFNTVMAALAQGLPLVVAPFGADQPVHAARCAALGVGRVLDTTTLDPNEIRAATRAVLDDPRYRRAAQRLQRDIDALPDIQAAADITVNAASAL